MTTTFKWTPLQQAAAGARPIRVPMSPTYGELAHNLLTAAGTPEAIMDAVTWTPTRPHTWTLPPVPGCSHPIGIGKVDLWGHFDLAHWQSTSPGHLFQSAIEIDALVRVEAALQTSGEGAKTLWGVSVIEPHDVRPGFRFAPLFVHTLIYFGTPLPEAQLDSLTERLADWGRVTTNHEARTSVGTFTVTEWCYGV